MKLSEAIKILEVRGVSDAKHDAVEIFAQLGGIKRASTVYSDPETSDEGVISAIERRANREPLQYILGRTFFYNEEYEVDENCLIPRSDTEILVDYAVNNIPSGAKFVDLCTGSGCVAVSTLKNTENTRAVMVDISPKALDVARRNADKNGVYRRAEFVLMDVTERSVEGEYFAVLSNPPYVKDSVYETLEGEIFYEPKIAFVGGDDGLDFYRTLTPLYKDKIDPCGFIAYEIGYDQGDALRKIARECEMSCEIIKDFSANDRVAVLRKNNH